MLKKVAYFLRKVQISRVNNSKILWFKNAKFLWYCFYTEPAKHIVKISSLPSVPLIFALRKIYFHQLRKIKKM